MLCVCGSHSGGGTAGVGMQAMPVYVSECASSCVVAVRGCPNLWQRCCGRSGARTAFRLQPWPACPRAATKYSMREVNERDAPLRRRSRNARIALAALNATLNCNAFTIPFFLPRHVLNKFVLDVNRFHWWLMALKHQIKVATYVQLCIISIKKRYPIMDRF